MVNLTSLDLTQFLVPVEVGALFLAAGGVTYLIMARQAPVAKDPKAAGAEAGSQQTLGPALAYRPVPVVAARKMNPGIQKLVAAAKSGDLEKTAKMRISQAFQSSKRILSAVYRQVIPHRTMKQFQFFFAGVVLGPYSEEQVQRYLQEGYLSPSDLAKDESSTEWSPLQKILDNLSLRQSDGAPADESLAETTKISFVAPAKIKIKTKTIKPLKPAHVCKQGKPSVPVPKIVSLGSGTALANA